jgi:hypothetical protein
MAVKRWRRFTGKRIAWDRDGRSFAEVKAERLNPAQAGS